MFQSILVFCLLLHASTASASPSTIRSSSLFDIRREVLPETTADVIRTSSPLSRSILKSPNRCNVGWFGRVKGIRGGDNKNNEIFSTWCKDISQPLSPDRSFSFIKDGDGSQEDPDGIPTRYLIAHKQNREKALKAFQHTLEWRQKEGMDTILFKEQENFAKCHEIFPVFFPGRDPEGHLIVVQRPGMVDLSKAHDYNITSDDVLMHYLFMIEYTWNLLDPAPLPPDGLMTTIVDCTGVKFSMVRSEEFRAFGKKLVGIMSEHYPTRSYKTLIIHAPRWFKSAFNLVKPLMRESTRKKIMILNTGPEQDRILKEVLGSDNDALPLYLLSTTNNDDGEANTDEQPSDIEKEMRLFASIGLAEGVLQS